MTFIVFRKITEYRFVDEYQISEKPVKYKIWD